MPLVVMASAIREQGDIVLSLQSESMQALNLSKSCWAVLSSEPENADPKSRGSRGDLTVACACGKPWPLLQRWPERKTRDNRTSTSPPRSSSDEENRLSHGPFADTQLQTWGRGSLGSMNPYGYRGCPLNDGAEEWTP
ncbi:hypothetical protein EYF80_011300 [Liparis tanakae]|uniref:Uncharacterized protein n=1 Tax=Liparis tanakae TaxID=230148 RepID=A0A4Z2IL87_9TELE|nr:hypothetical protein EYF80_011300 [Liparis tanakae]